MCPIPINFIDIYDELLNPQSPQFLIEGMIEDHTTGAVFGETGSGKTFVALALACSVVTGAPWAGHDVIRQGPVIYFAGEGRQGISRRVAAWEQFHKTKVPAERLFRPEGLVEFSTSGALMVIEAVDDLEKKYESPVLLVIDTLARALPAGSDENSSKDMMAFVNIIDRLRDKYKCVVIIIHHTGHNSGDRARGSSALKAALDWEILTKKIKKKKGNGIFEVTKMKEADIPKPLLFEIVSIGESAAISFGPYKPDNVSTLNESEKNALIILESTFARIGRQVATVEEWREDFYQLDKAEKQDTKRQNFNRARKALVDKGKLLFDDTLYTVAGQTGQPVTNP